MSEPNLIRHLRLQAAARLRSFAYFDRVPVITRDQGDLGNHLIRLTEMLGTCVVVDVPRVTGFLNNLSCPEAQNVQLRAEVYEFVTVNRHAAGSQKPSDVTALQIAGLWWNWTPEVPEGVCIIVDDIRDMQLPDPEECKIGWEVLAHITTGFEPDATFTNKDVPAIYTEWGIPILDEQGRPIQVG